MSRRRAIRWADGGVQAECRVDNARRRSRRDSLVRGAAAHTGDWAIDSLAHVVGKRLQEFACTSWTVCWTCSSANPRRLRGQDYGAARGVVVTEFCEQCTGHYFVPQVEEVPDVLRGLRPEELRALRPVALLQGNVWRPHPQGQRRHVQLSQLVWERQRVRDRIVQVEEPARCMRAYEFLMKHSAEYRAFIGQQDEEINAGRAGRALSTWTLLQEHIECALWPDLYWCAAWTDTRWGEERQHASVKRSFLTKVRSPVLDYGLCWDLLQFHYDRDVLAKFTARDRLTRGLSLRWALADQPETPLYMYEKQLALLDIHRQLGPATMMMTFAPGAFRTTWPQLVEEERDETGTRVLNGHCLESLHLLHVLHEVVRGYVIAGRWELRGHCSMTLLHSRLQEAQVLCWACRVEFQDGERRPQSQAYHGTGLPHVHVVLWLARPELFCLNRWLRADDGMGDSRLQSAVLSQQCSDRVGDLPIEEGESAWKLVGDVWELRLHRNEAAARLGVRVYAAPLCLAWLGHQDWTFVRSSTEVLRYMAKLASYITKDHGLADATWVNSTSSGFLAARALLSHLRPSQAQMVSRLVHGGLVQLACSSKRVTLVTPDKVMEDTLFCKYLVRPAEDDDLCYAQWLREYNTGVEEPRRYQRRRRGLTALAIHYSSKQQDAYFGQWLVANIACREAAMFMRDEVAMVPEHHRWFATCRLLRPDLWNSAGAVRQYWEQENAHQAAYLDVLMYMYKSWITFTDLFLCGRLHAAVPMEEAAVEHVLNNEQQRFAERFLAAVDMAHEQGREGLLQAAPGFGLLGAAGTGKSVVLRFLLRRLHEQQRSVLLCSPTGALADEYRELRRVLPRLQVDTVDGAFHLWCDQLQTPPFADVVIIDEVGFLDAPKFESVMRQWDAGGRTFVLLCAGDFGQLQPPGGGQQACSTASWGQLLCTTLTTMMRSRDERFTQLQVRLRAKQLTSADVRYLTGGRVLSEGWPSCDEVQRHFLAWPETVMLCVKREDAWQLNNVALEALFPVTPLGVVDVVDMQSARTMRVHRGMRVMVTYNVNKSCGLVNGAFGVVEALAPQCLVVRLRDNQLHALHRLTLDLPDGRFTGYPCDAAYASTIAKMQGRTLSKVAIWTGTAASTAGYVAVSRVRDCTDLFWMMRPSRRFLCK